MQDHRASRAPLSGRASWAHDCVVRGQAALRVAAGLHEPALKESDASTHVA